MARQLEKWLHGYLDRRRRGISGLYLDGHIVRVLLVHLPYLVTFCSVFHFLSLVYLASQ